MADQSNYPPTTKPLSPSVYPPNEVFNSYRYSSPALNSTVTSPIDLKTVMNFPPSAMSNCKVPAESYGSSVAAMTTNAQSATSIMSPTAASVTRPFDHMHSYIPKHWIWSRNLFYPHLTNNNHLSAAALYANHGGAFSGCSELSSSISNKTESLNSNSPAQVTEINSDDSSLDSHDTEKVSENLNLIEICQIINIFFPFSFHYSRQQDHRRVRNSRTTPTTATAEKSEIRTR